MFYSPYVCIIFVYYLYYIRIIRIIERFLPLFELKLLLLLNKNNEFCISRNTTTL
jgi:hypothetical protein